MEQKIKKPIENREDIELMVNSFYEKVTKDDLIGPFFNEVAKTNWDIHLPKMYSFWSDLLLGSADYMGRPFPPHVPLGLEKKHFERWLSLFVQTVDEHFIGLKADEAKNRALRIASNFMTNIEWIANN